MCTKTNKNANVSTLIHAHSHLSFQNCEVTNGVLENFRKPPLVSPLIMPS